MVYLPKKWFYTRVYNKLKNQKMKKSIALLIGLVFSHALFAQGPPPPPAVTVPFDLGIGFFQGAILLWAGTRKYFKK